MAEPLQVKGFAWLNLLRFVKEKFGAAAVQQLAGAFPQYKAHFDEHAVLPIGWLPGAMHLGAVSWVVTQYYGGTTEGARRFGGELAARNVSSTFSSFARLEDLKVALSSTERAKSSARRFSWLTLVVRKMSPRGMPDARIASPTSGSVPYLRAVSMWR